MKNLFIILFVFCGLSLHAQKETWHWYFGTYAGLDFSTGTPLADTNSSMAMPEGCASISDSLGNLLFYTNGIKIWNKIYQMMDNGDSLMGHWSSTQSAIIIKQPMNDSIYFVFTLDAGDGYIYSPPHRGFRYSTVNINQNGGLGKVIIKNVLIIDSTSERVTAAKHCNGKDMWIIVSRKKTNLYYSYLLSNNGVTTNPVISQTGIDTNSNIWTTGYMKSSKDGKKIAVAYTGAMSPYYPPEKTEVFDFNSATGLLSNSVEIGSINTISLKSYGLEFSPNLKYLYVSYCAASLPGNSQIYQYDISSGNQATIGQSAVKLYDNYDTATFTYLKSSGALQMGCDNKIYNAFSNYGYLGVINYPDLVGLSCGFVRNGVYLNGRQSAFGLPTFFPGFFNIKPDFNISQHCLQFNFTAICDTTDLISVSWNFGDVASGGNNTSALVNPVHVFSDTGSYIVKVFYQYPCRADSVVKSIQVQLPVYNFPQGFINDTTTSVCKQLKFMPVCDSASLDSLVWDFGDGASGVNNSSNMFAPLHAFTNGGDFQVSLVLYAFCRTDTIRKTVHVNMPNLELGNDTTLCDHESLWLNAQVQTMLPTTYHWQNGDTNAIFNVSQAGLYFVAVDAGGCILKDSIHINYMMTPNIHLPNDTVICDDSEIHLSVAAGDYTLLWEDGSSSNYRIVRQAGNYWVTASNYCGSVTDDFNLLVNDCNCYLYYPNAFTPNKDNRNECFGPKYYCEFESYLLRIFDRWGELLYETKNPEDCWDGKYKNTGVPMGVYVWVVKYKSVYEKEKVVRGVVTVVR